MRTCFNCGNSTHHHSPVGRKNLKRIKAEAAYDPLHHFAYCTRRHVWLDTHRVDCGNWVHPLQYDVGRTELCQHVGHGLMVLINRHRYLAAGFAYVAFMAGALSLMS